MITKNLSAMRISLFIVSLSFFMESLDTTVINTAIPAMAHSLHVNPVDLKIALISYLLSLAIFIPVSGWVADKFGAKKIFIIALGIFTVSSLACGFAVTLPQLVAGRFIQGFGGALGLPVGRLIILRTFGRENLVNMMSRIVIVGALGLMLGPVVGGFITHYFSWHWIFWVNIPVGLGAILAAMRFLIEMPPVDVRPLDRAGFILFGTALAGFTFGLSAISETVISDERALTVLAVSGLLMAAYFWHSQGKRNPFVKTNLLRFRTFRVSVTGNLLARLGFGGVPFLLPLLLQICLGYSPQLSGLLLAPTAAGVLMVKTFALPLLRALGYRRLLLLNTLLAGLVIWAFMLINSDSSVYMIATLTFLFGLIVSMQYSAMNSLAYADIPHTDFSAATSIMGTLQQFALSTGVAFSALLLRLFEPASEPGFNLSVGIFHHVFFVMGLVTVLAAFIFVRIEDNDGKQMIYGKSSKVMLKQDEAAAG